MQISGTVPWSLLLFLTHTGNDFFWFGQVFVMCFSWLLLMLILAKLGPNFANYLVVCEFGCAIFQTYDGFIFVKLSVFKLEVENRLEAYNL